MASSQNSQQSSVRDNRAFRLRAGQLSAKTRPPGTWAPTSAQPGMFGTPERCPPQSLPPAPPMLTPDHSPIRRVPGVKTSRNTSPAHSLRTGSSACSLPNRLKKRSTVILRTNIGMQEAAKRKFNKLPPKPTASFNKPKLVGPSTKLGPKADASGRKPHQRIIALNRLKAVDAMHKRLQALQSELFAKIRALGDDAKDLDGVYKFVTMVVNDECKLVAHSDDMRALPPTLPAESINDLKDRCRAVIDMGFVTFYDAMSSIQLCKTEWEARIQREDLRSKLGQVVAKRMKSIIKQIDELCSGRVVNAGDPNSAVYKEIQDVRTQRQNAENRFFELKQKQIVDIKALRAELEVQMTEEIGLRDHQISELQAALRRNEQEVQDLSEMLENKNTEMSAAEDTIEKLNAELREIKAINETIQERLEEADAGLLRATKMINNNDTAIEYLNSELKDAREFIVQLQKSPDALDPEEMVEKDQIIADLKLKLKNFEQHKSLVEKQVTTAVMQMSEYDELNGKFQVALTQMNDLKDKLRVSTAELDKSARTEQHLRKDILKLREQSERDQKMLSMRSDLINTLQESERDAKKKLEEMYSQSNEKDSLIDQVNNMLVSKEEEFRCVFGTLTYKQRELRRQEHIIQLLEDQQSRTSMMRTKQDERNAAMQEEIVNLKQTIYTIMLGPNPENVDASELINI
ncbi:hypothetical protein KR018_004695 [Drosophila ironensis]|nr:hypothetical protein KR018_004695 [Drosophila ironensis]